MQPRSHPALQHMGTFFPLPPTTCSAQQTRNVRRATILAYTRRKQTISSQGAEPTSAGSRTPERQEKVHEDDTGMSQPCIHHVPSLPTHLHKYRLHRCTRPSYKKTQNLHPTHIYPTKCFIISGFNTQYNVHTVEIMVISYHLGNNDIRDKCYFKQVGCGCGSRGAETDCKTQGALPGTYHSLPYTGHRLLVFLPKPNSKRTEWEG